MTKTYRKDETKPSDMFIDSIASGFGSADIKCGWCNRIHLCPNTDYAPDYEDSLSIECNRKIFAQYCIEEQKKNPEGVVLHPDCDTVYSKTLNGIKFVIGCPCNGISRYEEFIWNERKTIRDYLKKRINQEYEYAQQEKTLNVLAGFEDEDKDFLY
jgi:hypothetical protein